MDGTYRFQPIEHAFVTLNTECVSENPFDYLKKAKLIEMIIDTNRTSLKWSAGFSAP